MPSTPTSAMNSSMLLSSTSSITPGLSGVAARNVSQRLTPNEVKAVHYVMRLLHKHGRLLLQSIPGLIARAPDHLVQLIGFARDDLVAFFKRHNAIFQLHIDGTVSVKSDAVRTLLNKTDSINTNSMMPLPSTPLTQSSGSAMTATGIVIRIFPKYGILNMDNNEQVFFDIQSCHFETFNDLTCVLNPGDTMNFNAILGPKEGSTRWKSLKTWPRQNTRPNLVHSASTNNLSSLTSSTSGYVSPPSFDQYSNASNGYAPLDQDFNAYQIGNEVNGNGSGGGGFDDSNDGGQASPIALMNSTNANRHSRLGLPTLDEEQCPLPKMAGGLDAEVLRRNLQQMVQRTNAVSLREPLDETGRYISQGCQTTSTGEILATNIHIE